IAGPDPAYAREKGARGRLIHRAATHPEWAPGFAAEVWRSRVAQPAIRAWTAAGQPLRLVEPAGAEDRAPARALYRGPGRWGGGPPPAAPAEARWPRFADGRPLSGVTTQDLAWCCARPAAAGKTALVPVGDNASWHAGRAVTAWPAAHNRTVKATGDGVRIVA